MGLPGIDGKNAFVTGAGGGIGEAVARALAAAGASVAVTDVDGARAESVAESIVAGGGRARAWACDVASTARVEEVVAEAEAALGELGLLANVAGIFRTAPLLTLTDELFEQIFA